MMLLIILSLCACNEDSTMLSNDSDSKILDEAGSVTESESENEEEKAEETPSRPIPQNFLGYNGEKDAFSTNVIGTRDIAKDKIMSITFLDTLADMPENAWDASQDKNGSVMAWVDEDFNLFIAGEGGVTAPVSCKGMFKDYYNAQYINFNNCFYTDLVEDMSSMLASSDGFKELDLSFFNTSNVTDMKSMFTSCKALSKVDLSSFDFSLLQNASEMFAYSEKLVDINCTIALPEGCVADKMYIYSGLE